MNGRPGSGTDPAPEAGTARGPKEAGASGAPGREEAGASGAPGREEAGASGARLDVAGPAAPPRRNGELAFDEPWQGRLFAITLALHDAGVVPYERFRTELIAEIGRWEAAHRTTAELPAPTMEYRYWDRWAAALAGVLSQLELLDRSSVQDRAVELAGRPAGHDHHDQDDDRGEGGHDHGRAAQTRAGGTASPETPTSCT